MTLPDLIAKLEFATGGPNRSNRMPPSDLNIAEGISGTWFYHLRSGDTNKSLCGTQVMLSGLPLSAWGTVTHIGERYCSKCAALRAEQEKAAVLG